MKKFVFWGALLILFISCNKSFSVVTISSKGKTDIIYPYKAASCNVHLAYDYQATYSKGMSISFLDSCSDNVCSVVRLNNVLIDSNNLTQWSLDIDSTLLSHGETDTLSLDIVYSGLSKRYGWNYEKRVSRKYYFDSRQSVVQSSHNCTPYANALFLNLSFDGDSILCSADNWNFRMTTEAVPCPAHNEILFISSGGNQLHIRTNWPEGGVFDELTLWYGDKLLDSISVRGWEKRYYLDEFPDGGSFYLHVVKGAVERDIPLKVYTYYGM